MCWHQERDSDGMWCTTMIHSVAGIPQSHTKIRSRSVLLPLSFHHTLIIHQAHARNSEKGGKKGGFKGFFGGKKGGKA